MSMKKLIIEVRANEYTMRDDNSNVPWTASELGRDAYACRQAGAAIYHYHARGTDGSPDHSFKGNAEAIRAIRDRAADVLIHPTLGWATFDASPQARLETIEALCADPAVKPDFAPMDMGSTNVDLFDRSSLQFATDEVIYRNPTATLLYFAKRIPELGLKPYVTAWNIGFSRQIDAFLRAGHLSEPLYMAFVLTDGRLIAGHPGTLPGLRAHLDFLPAGRNVEWTACNYGGDMLQILAPIIAQGGHVSIGLGDHGYRSFGLPTNADIVRFVADMAAKMGRDIASPQEAKAMLGMQ
jgi:3-keto-5-aminohexanoate cleavage enzyme